MEEKHLVLRQINLRFQKKQQTLQMQENLHNVPFGGLIKKIMRDNHEEPQ
jgi:hypothetical protein